MDLRMRRFLHVLARAGIKLDELRRERRCLFQNCFVGLMEGPDGSEVTLVCATDISADEAEKIARAAQGEVLVIFPERLGEILDKEANQVINGTGVVTVNRQLVIEYAIGILDSDSGEKVILIGWSGRGDERFYNITRDRADAALYRRIEMAPPPERE